MCEAYLNIGSAAADFPAAVLLLLAAADQLTAAADLAAAEQDAAALHLAARTLRRIAQDAIKAE